MENDDWYQARPLVALSVLDQPLVDSLVEIIRKLWDSGMDSGGLTPNLAERDLDTLHRIIARR